jgi:multicomponent Na+:H+ antiporter subunit B
MNTLILRTVAPALTALMLLFSVFVLLRGHNEPGGGFIGGLIAASALAIYGIAFGVGAVRRAILFHPMAIAGAGLFIATLSGLLSILFGRPFMTGLWIYPELLGVELPLSTVISFDLGVYMVVLGSIVSIALALEQDTEELGTTHFPVEGGPEEQPPVPTESLASKRAKRARQKRENG